MPQQIVELHRVVRLAEVLLSRPEWRARLPRYAGRALALHSPVFSKGVILMRKATIAAFALAFGLAFSASPAFATNGYFAHGYGTHY